ncbi:DUF2971 domain-containing protein [Microbacterium gallinarum]|uniref:DUF2971 domain-containing protein n=1 Tax=Microbacterium gallinarum TaxID=2762209 RepID=A0ABR8X6C7_9MICO|nr:DUF2971 domain-containing protein [Microbacterium gallinarum]MBD8024875.1 DUF2971 domain-containing protein [Microbacterium gallinarum]
MDDRVSLMASSDEPIAPGTDPPLGATLTEMVSRIGWPTWSGKVYHYTDGFGAHGILEKRRIFATAAFALNDTGEFLYGLERLRSGLERRPRTAAFAAAHDEVNSILENLAASGPMAPAYIFSTSTSPRVLSQYQNYSIGQGYSLEFDTSRELVAPNTGLITGAWLRVVYDLDKQAQLVDSTLTRLVDERDQEREFLDQRITHILTLAALSMKDDAFASEHEVRRVWMTWSAPKYRVSRRGLVPYVELAHEWPNAPGVVLFGWESNAGQDALQDHAARPDSILDIETAFVGPPAGLDLTAKARALHGHARQTGSPRFEVFDPGIAFVG